MTTPAASRPRGSTPISDRLEAASIPVTESGCWIWTRGTNSQGYGEIWLNGRMQKAHRVSWVARNGLIPNGLHVLHRCDVRACINPDHLFLGTQKDNIDDMDAKGRRVRPLGKKNGRHTMPHRTRRGADHPWSKDPTHSRGERNPQAKISELTVLAIRAWTGSQASASRHFGVSTTTVNAIVTRKRWKHI